MREIASIGDVDTLQLKRHHVRQPAVSNGMRIGLFGGSFNPPHEGHRHVSDLALLKLKLDQIWWLVSPGNPLKDNQHLPPLMDRINKCVAMNSNPRVKITGLEAGFKTRYTADTVRRLRNRNPGVKFVWIMGADNLTNFHHWQCWKQIASDVPIAVIDRPGSTLSNRSSQAAIKLTKFRMDESDAKLLPELTPPAWVFLHGRRMHTSSTQLRKNSPVPVDNT